MPFIPQDHNNWSSVSTSFEDQQLGEFDNLSRSAFAENNRISLVDNGHYNAYESVATPGNFTQANPWATAHPNNHTFIPFVNSNPLQLTANTFAAGFAADAADNVDPALPTVPIPDAWGVAAPAIHSNNNSFAPSVLSPLSENTFATNATHNGGITYPTAPNAYTAVAGAPAGPMNNNAFAPSINSNLSPLTRSTFATNATYNGGITHPTAPNPHALGGAAPAELMNHYMGPGFHYQDTTLPMMNSFAAHTNSNAYPVQFPATSLNTQPGAAIDPPNSSHTTHNSDDVPLVLARPRPTCSTCNRSFSRQADLARHAKSHKADAKIFRCGCGYRSYRKDKLGEHVSRSGHRVVGVSGNGV